MKRKAEELTLIPWLQLLCDECGISHGFAWYWLKDNTVLVNEHSVEDDRIHDQPFSVGLYGPGQGVGGNVRRYKTEYGMRKRVLELLAKE